jgi:hypothetical protein
MVKYLVFLARRGGPTEKPDREARRSGPTEWLDGEARRSGPTERPDGVARDTQWASRADGHPDGCPMEDGRASDGGRTGARRRPGVARQRARCVPDGGRGLGGWPNGGSRGWPNGGLYKGWWPSFLGTLFVRPVAPARNARAQGAHE